MTIHMFLNFFPLFVVLTMSRVASEEPFHCDSPDEIEEFKIKMVFMFKGNMYLIHGKEFLFFRSPSCFFNAEKQVNCAFSQPFRNESNFNDLPGKLKLLGSSI